MTAPVAIVKAGISAVQLAAAMRNVATFDVEERWTAANAKPLKGVPTAFGNDVKAE